MISINRIYSNKWQRLDDLFGMDWYEKAHSRNLAVFLDDAVFHFYLDISVFWKHDIQRASLQESIHMFGDYPSLGRIKAHCEFNNKEDYRSLKNYREITFYIDPVPQKDLQGDVFPAVDLFFPGKPVIACNYRYKLLIRSAAQTFVSEPFAILNDIDETTDRKTEFSAFFINWSPSGKNHLGKLYIAKNYIYKGGIEIMLEDKTI
ncbi:hypothetical protein HZA96_03535 [Candidatus Woesearchaeota archaeon]|nr:hypothetical protein [Candidatus Woesearchaeota archaeon]